MSALNVAAFRTMLVELRARRLESASCAARIIRNVIGISTAIDTQIYVRKRESAHNDARLLEDIIAALDTATEESQQYLEKIQQADWFVTENRRAVVVCAVADLLPTRGPSPRFPTPCARCGAGTYTGASVVEHDGPCAPCAPDASANAHARGGAP